MPIGRPVKTPIRWPPKAIFFDLDGTLIDSAPDVLAAFRSAFAALGIETPEEESLLSVIGLRLEDCFARFLGGDAERAAKGAKLFRRYYRDHYMDRTSPYPGIPKSVRELSSRYRLAVATMKKGEYARALVRGFGWLGTFERIIGAEDGYPPKPDPTMLQALCRGYDIRPDEAVYVGDTSLDVRMAVAAKIPVFFAAYGYGTLGDEDRALVNGTVDSSAELWKVLTEAWAPLQSEPEPPPPAAPIRQERTSRAPSRTRGRTFPKPRR
jgi:phosphoglycolate phosphatase